MGIETYVKKFKDGGYITANGTKIVFYVNAPKGSGISGTISMSFPMACHNATYIWLYQATHEGAFPPQEALEVGKTQTFVNKLITFGNAKRVTEKNPPLAADVLIFADPDLPTQGLHSCAAIKGGKTIAGYNQTGWFKEGLVDDYSEHPVSSLNWVKRSIVFTNRRVTAAGAARYLWAVREATAMDVMINS
jgi:hypothetical protein